MQQAELEGHKTGQERESYAYAHPEYLELLAGLRVAVEKNESFRNRMLIAQERIGVYRTSEASKRAEEKRKKEQEEIRKAEEKKRKASEERRKIEEKEI